VRSQNYGIKIRVSIVSYRDIGQPEQYVILPFTDDASAPKQFLEKLGTKGGIDYPEDVAGGLQKALEQKWESKTRYAVIIGDAPAHGKKYHNFSDRFQGGDPTGLVIED
jgi:hypothetical protein